MRTYYKAKVTSQSNVTLKSGDTAIVLELRLVSKSEKGKDVPIDPREEKCWITKPNRDFPNFSIAEQEEALVDSIMHHNPQWDGDMNDLGLTDVTVSVSKKGDKQFVNLAGPPRQSAASESADINKSWGSFSRFAKKKAQVNRLASEPASPAVDESAAPVSTEEDPF